MLAFDRIELTADRDTQGDARQPAALVPAHQLCGAPGSIPATSCSHARYKGGDLALQSHSFRFVVAHQCTNVGGLGPLALAPAIRKISRKFWKALTYPRQLKLERARSCIPPDVGEPRTVSSMSASREVNSLCKVLRRAE
jgi:hypothetical protein